MPEPGMIAASIAESLLDKQEWSVYFSSDTIRSIHPEASDLLLSNNFPIPSGTPKHPNDLQDISFDAVVTFCESSVKMCPTFPGIPARFHWPIDDLIQCEQPPTRQCFVDLLAQLKVRVDALITHGTLNVVLQLRNTFGTVIDHLTDGVMAHDAKRRIFVFNSAAERITGYSSNEVVGRDCHDVFPGLFCGGNCSFCSGKVESGSNLKYPSKFVAHNGDMLDLEMSSIPLTTQGSRTHGSLLIFKDQTEVNRLKRTLQQKTGFFGIIGNHPSMQQIYNSISELADETVPVLVTGESGTGKELIAEALHKASKRKNEPFVPVNCGALPEGIIESELFGHVKGAFTGAFRDKKGRFELAENGTLFLDEIGEISQSLQVKLLRVLENKTYIPVGGEKEKEAHVRVVFATNKNLQKMVSDGTFREDLYYRIAVFPLEVPALRNRREDIHLLGDHLLDQASNESGRNYSEIEDDVYTILRQQDWPGNVRQLANTLQYALIKCNGGVLRKEHLPPDISFESFETLQPRVGRPTKLDVSLVARTLRKTGGNRARAARELSVARSTLYRFIDDHPELS